MNKLNKHRALEGHRELTEFTKTNSIEEKSDEKEGLVTSSLDREVGPMAARHPNHSN